MRNIIFSICLSSLICLGFVFCVSTDNHYQIAETVKAQTRATATPCPSPVTPSNMVDPCHPLIPPTPEEIAATEKRIEEFKIKRERILTANYPLISKSFADFDSDGKKDEIIYRIEPFEDYYQGSLKITSATGKILWEDNYPIDAGYLAEWLSEMHDDKIQEITVTDWVKNAFNKKFDYSFEVENRKIKRSVIDDDQIDHAAKLNKISARKLKSEILLQKINRIFTYRATEREDLMQIVYIPALEKFVCFSRGYN